MGFGFVRREDAVVGREVELILIEDVLGNGDLVYRTVFHDLQAARNTVREYGAEFFEGLVLVETPESCDFQERRGAVSTTCRRRVRGIRRIPELPQEPISP